MADAAWSNAKNGFAFTLDHKAAYLLFLPRTSNTILHDCYLTKVEVNSDNDITSTYTLNPVTGKLTGTGSGNQIVVATVGSGTYANGFPLTNNATSAATNGAYVVIKPGTHTLKVRYWVKDVATGTEGTITKTLSSAIYDQNKYYNITANLDVKNYDGDHYYMWDAQEQYWKGYEWTKNLGTGVGQPTLFGQPAGNYAYTDGDSRNANESYPGYRVSNSATHSSFNNVPNVNEMTWYAAKGDPRGDKDELWTTMGHLYKGGMWFKKKVNISGFNSNTAYDGTDWRTIKNYKSWEASEILLSAAEAGNYFYLPAMGYYRDGQLYINNINGAYWSSSAQPESRGQAYMLEFNIGYVTVGYGGRYQGLRVGAFE